MPKFCSHCGTPLKEDAKFCASCGQPVAQASQPQAPNQQRPGANQPSAQPKQQTPKQTPKKKRSKFKVFLVLFLIASAVCGIKGYLQHKKGGSDDFPTVVLKGNGFKLEVAESDKDLEFTPVGDERVAELKQMGYNPIVTPIRVTRNGEKHVELSQCATVSFDIPKDFPKDKYDELVGVLITDEGPEYVIPDYYALKKGVVKFRTCHFSDATVDQNKDSLRKQFIENVAVNGWSNHINDEALKPKLKDKLEEYAKSLGLGEDDPMGVIVREIYEDNTILSIGSDLINAYDMEGDDIEKRIEVATETMVKEAEAKVLSYLFDKLKEEDTKKKKVIDEMKSGGNETIYKTEIEEIDSKRNKIIDIIEDRFSIENVEKASKKLGGMTTFDEFYVFAKKQLKKQGKEKLKEISINLCPYIKTVQAEAKGAEYLTKFIGITEFNYFYKRYKEVADTHNGNVSDEEWSFITIKSSTPNFWHGMSNEEIRQKLAERYQKEAEIEKRRKEATETVELIESRVDLEAKCFKKKKLDYSQRLTVVNNLLNRFRAELVDKNGNLTFIDAKTKERQYYSAEANQKWQLCKVVNAYLKYYPDQEKFYTWLAKNGYYQNKLKDNFDRLDALLDKPQKPKSDPRVSILIQETFGSEAGYAKYLGYTICLGTNGKPCPGWCRNIPVVDSLRDGWSTRYPETDEDSFVRLSQYKALGRPNQVLIYKNEKAYEKGEKPLEAIDFVLDTTGLTTVVELNRILWGEYSHDYVKTMRSSKIGDWGDSICDTHIQLMKNGYFTITGGGDFISDYCCVKRNFTISGHVDYSTQKGTFTMKATYEFEEFELMALNNYKYKESLVVENSGEVFFNQWYPENEYEGIGYPADGYLYIYTTKNCDVIKYLCWNTGAHYKYKRPYHGPGDDGKPTWIMVDEDFYDYYVINAQNDKPKKKKNNPKVSIVIQETLGAEAGNANYAGHTICLATNGRPYKDWYYNIPNDNKARHEGWSTTYPNEGSSILLSQYDSIGCPNQLLVYKNAMAFEKGEAPLESINFVVDTTGHPTVVELHVADAAEVYTCSQCWCNAGRVELGKIENTVIKIMKNGDFTMVSSVENEYSTGASANVTISGHVDKDTGSGTFKMSGTVTTIDNYNITFETSGEVMKDYDEIMRVRDEYYYNSCKEGSKAYLYFTPVNNSDALNIVVVACNEYVFDSRDADDPEYTGRYCYGYFFGKGFSNNQVQKR